MISDGSGQSRLKDVGVSSFCSNDVDGLADIVVEDPMDTIDCGGRFLAGFVGAYDVWVSFLSLHVGIVGWA